MNLKCRDCGTEYELDSVNDGMVVMGYCKDCCRTIENALLDERIRKDDMMGL
jgi:hypothetical protein